MRLIILPKSPICSLAKIFNCIDRSPSATRLMEAATRRRLDEWKKEKK